MSCLTPKSISTASGGSVMAVEDFLGGISRPGLCAIASRYNNNIPCTSDPQSCIPTFGTFNVVVPLEFANGDKWIARIPRPGRMFTNPNPRLLEQIMNSLVVTVRLVRERTCIPVPAVHAWSAHDDNEAGCPYMFMDHIDGVSLGDCLQDLPPEKTSNIIYEWAMYTWELTRIRFPAIGCLGICLETGRVSVQKYVSAGSVDQGRDNISPFYRGPYNSVTDYLFGISQLKKLAPLDHLSYDRFSFGTYLESMIPFAIKPEWSKGPFCLCHDDFNVQNILVDPEAGRITAIIDWDYACIKPIQSLLSYPESLRWDLLASVNASFEPYQHEWAAKYRQHWANAMSLASRNIPTGCALNVVEFLDDSPLYASLERGLGESWREAEAMKFCNAIVYGALSSEVLRSAGQGMRTGPWMSIYANRAGYSLPSDLACPAPIVKRNSLLGKVKSGVALPRPTKRTRAEARHCEWRTLREKLLKRKKIKSPLGRWCQEDNDTLVINMSSMEKMEVVNKRLSWWSIFGRTFYGVRERTLPSD